MDAILAGFSVEMILIAQTVLLFWFWLDLCHEHHSGKSQVGLKRAAECIKMTTSKEKIHNYFLQRRHPTREGDTPHQWGGIWDTSSPDPTPVGAYIRHSNPSPQPRNFWLRAWATPSPLKLLSLTTTRASVL